MFSRHLESDYTSRLSPNAPVQEVTYPVGERDDDSNEENNCETYDAVDEENDETIDETADETADEENDEEKDEEDGGGSKNRNHEQDVDENDLVFRTRPRDYSSSPPPNEKRQQLADAVAEHERLLGLADWSAHTYDRYHEELHNLQLQIFDLRAPNNPAGLTMAARANAERGAIDMKSYWSICMEGERQRWINTRKEIRAIRVKVSLR